MIKLYVYFKETKLGCLFKENGQYVFMANENGVQKAINKGYPIWLFGVEKSFVANELPISIQNLIPDKDCDLNELAGISYEDDELTKLQKIANLSLEYPELHIGLK